MDKLVALVADKAKHLGERYERGELSLTEFHIEMRELLKSGHVAAASIGKGGWRRMTLADWGTVGAKLKSEYGFLSRFVQKLEKGKVDKIITPNRAKRYADGVVMSYHKTMRQEHSETGGIKVRLVTNSREGCQECAADESRGWVDPSDMAELGTRICQNFCKCDLIFSDDYEAGRVSF